MSPLIPLFILGLPILDTMAVMGQRLYEKRSPFSPDKNHIHHKLLDAGFDQYEAVFIIYLLQSALITIAYFMLYETDALLLIIYAAISAFVLSAFHYASIMSWKFHSNDLAESALLTTLIRFLRDKGWLTTVPTIMLKTLVPLLLVLSVVLAIDVKHDMAVLAVFLLIVLLGSSLVNSSISGIFEKAVVYVVAVMAIYLLPVNDEELVSSNIVNWVFVVLVIAFSLRVYFSHEKTFQITPLDYLVIILVMIVPNLPEAHLEDSGMGEMAVKLIILFYASEAVMGLKKNNWDLLRLGTLTALSILVIRGL